jgi:hypothetical protein
MTGWCNTVSVQLSISHRSVHNVTQQTSASRRRNIRRCVLEKFHFQTHRLHEAVFGTDNSEKSFGEMPYFYFDLVICRDYRDQGGMILENMEAAIERADRLAEELAIIRPELKSKGCAVRVTDDDGKEVYRTLLHPVSTPNV